MKKLIQIAVVVILVLALVPAVTGGTMVFAGSGCSTGAQNTCSTTGPTSLNLQVATCLAGRICMTPNVGWNS